MNLQNKKARHTAAFFILFYIDLFVFVKSSVPHSAYCRNEYGRAFIGYGQSKFSCETKIERKSEKRDKEREKSSKNGRYQTYNSQYHRNDRDKRRKDYAFYQAFFRLCIFFKIFFVFFSHNVFSERSKLSVYSNNMFYKQKDPRKYRGSVSFTSR